MKFSFFCLRAGSWLDYPVRQRKYRAQTVPWYDGRRRRRWFNPRGGRYWQQWYRWWWTSTSWETVETLQTERYICIHHSHFIMFFLIVFTHVQLQSSKKPGSNGLLTWQRMMRVKREVYMHSPLSFNYLFIDCIENLYILSRGSIRTQTPWRWGEWWRWIREIASGYHHTYN